MVQKKKEKKIAMMVRTISTQGKKENLLVFYCGDRLCCNAGSDVLGCRFQTGPHGCKS